MPIGLYIHVPFCKRKCPYCDFYSLVLTKQNEKDYADAVVRNIENFKGTEIDSIYFGGGTPSLLSMHSYFVIFKAIKENLILSKNCEISLEANPNSVDEKKLKSLKNVGFNRISFGVQSCDDSELEILGRLHNFIEAKNAILSAKNVGFDNISADLMLGIVGQNADSLSYSIRELSKLPINHISAYILKIEENTPYNNIDIIKNLPDDDNIAELYIQAVDELYANGFSQYEISNFAKSGYECKHNLKYWRCEEYIGIGPSAHSFFGGKRFEVPKNLQEFIDSKVQNQVINEENPHTFEEVAMLRLRLSEGLTKDICDEFLVDFNEIIKKAQPLKKAMLVDIFDDKIAITKNGFLVSNAIITKLLY